MPLASFPLLQVRKVLYVGVERAPLGRESDRRCDGVHSLPEGADCVRFGGRKKRKKTHLQMPALVLDARLVKPSARLPTNTLVICESSSVCLLLSCKPHTPSSDTNFNVFDEANKLSVQRTLCALRSYETETGTPNL